MKVLCRVGLHWPWRTLPWPPSKTPIGAPFQVLGVSVLKECASCGLVRVEGRWAGVYMATLSSGPQSERSAAGVTRALQEAESYWARERRERGLSAT